MFTKNSILTGRIPLVSLCCAAFTLPLMAGQPVGTDLPLPLGESLLAQNDPTAPATGTPSTPDVQAASAEVVPSIPPQVAPPIPGPAKKSPNVTINLINRLVAKGILEQAEADEMISQAEDDAAAARAEIEVTQGAVQQIATVITNQQLGTPQDFGGGISLAPGFAAPDGEEVHVTYIPENVKAELREQIKQELLSQAKNEKWLAPNVLPDWAERFKLFADIRTRYQGDFFNDGNDNTGAFPNFNAINTGAPFDVAGTQFSPQLNVDQDRQRVRLRLRLGLTADMGDGFTGGLRIATGDSNSPTSTNQSLGSSGGNFSKYAIWLDRAFLKYEIGGLPDKNLSLSIGRFDNPFFSTDVVWDEDIGFDGVALQAKYPVGKNFVPFIAGGAFPVYNTDYNFASNQPAKFASDDKWLYGAQLGTNWKITKDLTAKVAGAYYYFDGIEGQLSDPYTPLSSSDAGNTDATRPSFAQKGNTYMALRNIVPNASNNFGTTNQYQYFGLATPFENFVLTGRLDYNGFEPFQVSLIGEYAKNLAFDQEAINVKAINNRGSTTTGGLTNYEGGDTAWLVGIKVGKAVLEKRGDWTFGIGYRYVESDAVVDGFTDSDFGGGGTNVKGFTIGGSVAISPRVNFGVRWMSSDQIAGPPLKSDTLMLEINGKF